jgi:hypothetical protein
MEQAFDAYHKWLGIPPECQPPDQYRLLGLQTFESDPDVIQSAADQRMMHLRAYQTGKNSDWSQRLLNEVAAAKVCLLNAAKKAAYDQKLRESLGSGLPKASPPPLASAAPPSPPPSFAPNAFPSQPSLRGSSFARQPKRNSLGPLIIGLASVAVLLIGILGYWIFQQHELLTITIQQANAPSPPAVVHDLAASKTSVVHGSSPIASDAKKETVPKPGKTSQNDRSSSAKLPASKDSSPPDHLHPNLVAPPGTVAKTRGDDATKVADSALPKPLDLPPKTTKTEKPPADSNRKKDEETPPIEPAEKERPSTASDGLAAEPSVESQEESLKLARDLYKDELAKARAPEEKQAFAKKLLDRAEAAANADVGTFVLYRLARDVAAQALDGVTASAAVDALAERYRIDAIKMKMELLLAFAKKARMPSQHLVLAEQAAWLMIEAQADEDYNRASDLARLAVAEGGLAHDKELVTLAKAGLKENQEASALASQFNAAQAALAKTPDDPSANLAVGTFYCVLKNDWNKGLPCLAKGDNPDLKRLAERELKSPSNSAEEAEEEVMLANAWWEAGQNAEGAKRGAMIRRSAYWCNKIKSQQPGGLNAVKAERRLTEIAKIEQEAPAVVLAARPSVPINKWFPLLTSSNELTGWQTGDCHFSYDKGVIELRDGEMSCPIVAKDVTIRAKVKYPITSTGQVRLLLRNSSQGCYAARISDGVLSIVKQKRTVAAANQSAVGKSSSVDEDVLAKFSLPRNKRGTRVLDFEFGFAAVGYELTAFINGRAVLRAEDRAKGSAFSEGTVGLGTGRANNVYFADVVILIPNKTSFVTDQRSTAAIKPAVKNP